MQQDLQNVWSWAQNSLANTEMLRSIVINAVYALIILIVAMTVSGWVSRRIKKAGDRSKRLDPMLAGFLASFAKYAILALAVIFVLNRFGIETASLAALIAAMGLAIGLALQGTLSNLAAGVMMIAFRPFRTGDYIEAAGHSGTASNITLFFTELTTPQNVQIIVPNGDIWSSSIVNYSAHDTRRLDLVFGVSYATDLKLAERVLRETIAADGRVQSDPEPFVKVSNLGDSSVDFTVRVWCKASDYWDLNFALLRAVKEAFDANGVDIPFPTRTLLQAS